MGISLANRERRMDKQDFASLMLKVQDIAKEVVAPNAAAVDAEAGWPDAGIRALQREGLGGLVVPAAYGGKGYGLYALARACEILGQECASTAICFGMHCVGSSVISANATPDQQDRFLAPICEGSHITTLSLSEAGTGVHFYLPQTTMEAVSDDAFSLTGNKTFVTNGG